MWSRKTGKPLYNAIVWLDLRTASIADELKAEGGEDRFRATCGLPISTYFSGVKLKCTFRRDVPCDVSTEKEREVLSITNKQTNKQTNKHAHDVFMMSFNKFRTAVGTHRKRKCSQESALIDMLSPVPSTKVVLSPPSRPSRPSRPSCTILNNSLNLQPDMYIT